MWVMMMMVVVAWVLIETVEIVWKSRLRDSQQ
jgi:hypothetical protein